MGRHTPQGPRPGHVPGRSSASDREGLGKGRIPTATTRYVEPIAVAQEPMTAIEPAHTLASLNRRCR